MSENFWKQMRERKTNKNCEQKNIIIFMNFQRQYPTSLIYVPVHKQEESVQKTGETKNR